MDPQIGIQDWQQYPSILDDVGLGALSFQDNVLDNPPIVTRAGLYVYLNSMLHDKPSFEDSTVIEILNSRYKDDISSLVSDVILAAFDVLANAIYRNEPTRSTSILRSFLVNKVPVFIQAHYAGMIFEPLTVEHCIRQALIRVGPAAFPSLSQMFDPLGRNSLLSEARQDFLFACALHQLIPERSIEEVLGDVPMQSLPAGGRYIKDDLVHQCTANPTKIEEYISELENTEGNAGEIAAAIIEILHGLCANNDTMTLKVVCNALCRKSATLDVIMLFTRSVTLLRPLCAVLDNWQDHEDQGEYQPVYDEFGSILLFVVIVQHRFRLQRDDLGLEIPTSFVWRYLRDSASAKSLDDLTEHEAHLLSAWIKGLFETEGISDDLMSTCKPGEFHLLIATLFDQSLKASQVNVLALDTLKGSFEYLLEPFLLPSLIAGFTWFTHSLWAMDQESTNVNTVLVALHALIKPPSMSHDSSIIHSAVLSVVAEPLADSLDHVQKQHPTRPDIAPLLSVLNPYTQERHGATALSELAAWSITPNGGLLAALRQTIHALILWSATSASSSPEISPPSYIHRQILDTIRLLGAQTVLNLLVDEATDFLNLNSNSDIALDIITILIFTASSSPLQSPYLRNQLSLRTVLKTELLAVEDVARTDPARASTIVRLHRRVETLADQGKGGNGITVGTVGHAEEAANGLGIDEGDGVFMAGVGKGLGMEGLQPTGDIDDVLGEVEEQTKEAQEFLAADAGVLGLGEVRI